MELGNNKRKSLKKIPKSAISLYSHLYCKKKGSSSTKYYSNLVEATKSWTTLTVEEKCKFVEKLEECQLKYQNKLADYLKDAQPYLKKKRIKKVTQELEESAVADHAESVHGEIANESGMRNDDNWIDNLMDTVNPHESFIEFSEPLPEPDPPHVRDSVELFKIVKTMDRDNQQEWSSLNKTEKTRYRRALNKIKNAYITKYRAFLESLPSEQLFEYYQKTINS